MEKFQHAYERFLSYPDSLLVDLSFQSELDNRARIVDRASKRLFASEQSAKVNFWQLDYEGQGFRHQAVRNLDEMHAQLRLSESYPRRLDPSCRFVFIDAPHSQERLNISKEMLYVVLTYEQVMPHFLDFFMPFGRPQRTQDLKFSAFKQDSHALSALPDRLLEIPELGRSGRRFQICYNLRSVENYEGRGNSGWPWSVRQAAIHHSFDVHTGLANWIVVKGSTSLQDRVMASCRSKKPIEVQQFGNVGQAFMSTLFTHLLFSSWAEENWSSHISFLESEMERASEKAINAPVAVHHTEPSPSATRDHASPLAEKPSFSRAGTFAFSRSSTLIGIVSNFKPLISSRPNTADAEPGTTFGDRIEELSIKDEFPFEDIQRLQFLHETVSSVCLSIKMNTEVLKELLRFYSSISQYFDHHEESIRTTCVVALEHLKINLESSIWKHHTYQTRLESLALALVNRKHLLQDIHAYLNTKAGRRSACAMEDMTTKMHDIALKTKQETVSMKIITLVTLFFLPGTFICTLMSTDIVQFQINDHGEQRELYSSKALYLFLWIVLPMMCGVFIAWYCVYWWVNHSDKVRSQPELQGRALLNPPYKQFFSSGKNWKSSDNPQNKSTDSTVTIV